MGTIFTVIIALVLSGGLVGIVCVRFLGVRVVTVITVAICMLGAVYFGMAGLLESDLHMIPIWMVVGAIVAFIAFHVLVGVGSMAFAFIRALVGR